MIVIHVENDEMISALTREMRQRHIRNAAIVSLIGAVDRFTLSTMPAGDPSADIVTNYDQPAEMSGTGEVVDGDIHIHAVMALEGDRPVSGHLHEARVGHWFARVYLLPCDPGRT